MKKFLVFTLMVCSTSVSFAKYTNEALNLVPGGKVVLESTEEVKIQSPSGGIVEIEFSAGKFEEASGDNVDKDVLVPGNGLLSLEAAVAALKKKGKTPVGEWSLDQSLLRGWYYEFDGFENNQKMEYVVDAKTGELLESKIDD